MLHLAPCYTIGTTVAALQLRACELLRRDKGSKKGEERKNQIPIFSKRSLPRCIVSHHVVSFRLSQKKTASPCLPRRICIPSSRCWKSSPIHEANRAYA